MSGLVWECGLRCMNKLYIFCFISVCQNWNDPKSRQNIKENPKAYLYKTNIVRTAVELSQSVSALKWPVASGQPCPCPSTLDASAPPSSAPCFGVASISVASAVRHQQPADELHKFQFSFSEDLEAGNAQCSLCVCNLCQSSCLKTAPKGGQTNKDEMEIHSEYTDRRKTSENIYMYYVRSVDFTAAKQCSSRLQRKYYGNECLIMWGG